jgi:hypothetical protein
MKESLMDAKSVVKRVDEKAVPKACQKVAQMVDS